MNGKEINIGDMFKRQDAPIMAALQPVDYTEYPSGAKKIGLVCQDGLTKRKKDAEVFTGRAYDMKNKQWLGAVPTVETKAVSNIGLFSAVDKFFNWVNQVLK